MSSSLRAKLNRIASSAAPSPLPAVPGGLVERVHSEPLPMGLVPLDGRALARLGYGAALDVRRAAFLDTETTGLLGGAGTVAFLVGLGFIEGDRFTVRQLLMPSYADEPALMERVAELLQGCDALITFNGKSFDAPLLESRFTMCRMISPLPRLGHLDLIHPARRAWKLRLKKCDLGRLEAEILGCAREHDLPGSEVPERYFSFLRCGDMALLEDVMEHNRRDILSLGTLLLKLCRVYAAPSEQTDLMDLFSLGRAMEKQGELHEARRCYRLAAKPQPITSLAALQARPLAGQANYRLSQMLRRSGELDQAEGVWREMTARGQLGATPYIELSKLMEHTRRDPREALRLADQALQLAGDEVERAQIEDRRKRLERKLGRS